MHLLMMKSEDGLHNEKSKAIKSKEEEPMSKPAIPTLTELELFEISPERLDPKRRQEVADYHREHFLQGEGDEMRKKADEIIRAKIERYLEENKR
jgi:hypothetical protein